MLKVSPFENTQRHLRSVSDWQTYRRIHSTLPAIILAALKTRVKAGEPQAIQSLWDKKEKTFFAIDFEWSERNASSALEWGYAAVRCGHLQAFVPQLFSRACIRILMWRLSICYRQGHWPPVPGNYRQVLSPFFASLSPLIASGNRKGHYIVAEYVDKVVNKYRPTYPWQVRACICLLKSCLMLIAFSMR